MECFAAVHARAVTSVLALLPPLFPSTDCSSLRVGHTNSLGRHARGGATTSATGAPIDLRPEVELLSAAPCRVSGHCWCWCWTAWVSAQRQASILGPQVDAVPHRRPQQVLSAPTGYSPGTGGCFSWVALTGVACALLLEGGRLKRLSQASAVSKAVREKLHPVWLIAPLQKFWRGIFFSAGIWRNCWRQTHRQHRDRQPRTHRRPSDHSTTDPSNSRQRHQFHGQGQDAQAGGGCGHRALRSEAGGQGRLQHQHFQV